MSHTMGILLTNLGTPDEPTPTAVRNYLAEFLSDPRIVERQNLWWKLLLHGIILRFRPNRSAKKYRSIWTEDGSPLLVISERQRTAVARVLANHLGYPLPVVLGMRYGNPSMASALEQLRKAGAQRILVLPLYPQYAGATVGSTFDAVTQALRTWRVVPELRLITHYYHESGYLDALAATIHAGREHSPGERLLFSFHGLPARAIAKGDPYADQCRYTAEHVAKRLGLPSQEWAVAFQSRFGRAEWIMPHTQTVLVNWARSGIKRVDVVCPGFSADCLETLEEIAIENRERFLDAGGKRYRYLPALNDEPDHVHFLADLIKRRLIGWIDDPDMTAPENIDLLI